MATTATMDKEGRVITSIYKGDPTKIDYKIRKSVEWSYTRKGLFHVVKSVENEGEDNESTTYKTFDELTDADIISCYDEKTKWVHLKDAKQQLNHEKDETDKASNRTETESEVE